MIKKIITNIKKNHINSEDINYIYNLNDNNEISLLEDYVISKCDTNTKIKFESNIFYPLIYQIEDNCPTCGYRTPISRQKYSEEFIVRNLKYKFNDIESYPISSVNCYNKYITDLRELFIILDFLDKYNFDVNVAMSNYDNLKYLDKFRIKSIIYVPNDSQPNNFNDKNFEDSEEYEEKIIKYIKENVKLNVTYQLVLKYNESHQDIFNIIMKLKKYNIDTIELKGFDPFIDSPDEYNPQYSKEYILKFILLLKLYLPEIEVKIPFATNKRNFFDEFIKLGIKTFSGFYTSYMNSKLDNSNELLELVKK